MAPPKIYHDPTIPALRPKDLTLFLISQFAVDNPVLIHGAPGVGKTGLINSLTSHRLTKIWQQLSGESSSLTLWKNLPPMSAIGAVDLHGIPFCREDADSGVLFQRWARSELLPHSPDPDGNRILLFLDDLTAAPTIIQPALYELVQFGRVGKFQLPPGTIRIGAGNRQADRAAVNPLSTALKGRFSHIEFTCHHEDWTEVAFSLNIIPEIIAWINNSPESLLQPDPQHTATPSPRTWEKASNSIRSMRRVLRAANVEKSNPRYKALMLTAIASAVGLSEATRFVEYLELYGQIPSISQIKADPETAQIPTNKGGQILVATMVAMAVKPPTTNTLKADPENEALLHYLTRLPNELASMAFYGICSRHEEILVTSPTLGDWALKNSHIWQAY